MAFSRNFTSHLAHGLANQGAATEFLTIYDYPKGGSFKVPKLVYANTAASTAITGSSTETAFDTNYTIPANTLTAGSVIKVRFQGIATATNSTDTLTIKLYIGGLSGTALFTSTATDAVNNDIFAGEAVIVLRTVGSSGTLVSSGSYTKVEGASGTASRVDFITASTAIDTTATKLITASGTWSTTSGSNSCRMDLFTVEIAS